MQRNYLKINPNILDPCMKILKYLRELFHFRKFLFELFSLYCKHKIHSDSFTFT